MGFEPMTSTLARSHSSQLNYRRMKNNKRAKNFMGGRGLEPPRVSSHVPKTCASTIPPSARGTRNSFPAPNKYGDPPATRTRHTQP
jgi:hypothetical protein